VHLPRQSSWLVVSCIPVTGKNASYALAGRIALPSRQTHATRIQGSGFNRRLISRFCRLHGRLDSAEDGLGSCDMRTSTPAFSSHAQKAMARPSSLRWTGFGEIVTVDKAATPPR
jgi:hypothetical protein